MQEKKQTSAVTKWMTLIIVAIAGGLMTKLPYLREIYGAIAGSYRSNKDTVRTYHVSIWNC